MKRNILKDWLVDLISLAGRVILFVRYRIEVRGLEKLDQLSKDKGILFLPNHPAAMDPVILMILLWRRFRLAPLVLDPYYNAPGLNLLMPLIDAMPVPETTESVSKWKKKRIEKFFQDICKGLQEGRSFLIYPSGRLKLFAKETIGGASLVHTIIQTEKEAQVVLIRTSGLWGSMFSKAYTERSPNIGKTILEACKVVLKNGLFFAPKRKILIEFELPTGDFSRSASRMDFNRYLENWYNKPFPEGEPISQVSYSFWKTDLLVPYKRVVSVSQDVQIPDKIRSEVTEYLAKITKRPKEDIQPAKNLSQDLGLDSLDAMDIYLFLDKRYDIKNLQTGELQTVQDVLVAASGAKSDKEIRIEKVSVKLPKETNRLPVHVPLGETIQDAFLKAFCKRRGSVACMDQTSGILSYRKLFIAAFMMSKKLSKLEGKYIGIMLPSSVAAYIVILATLFAKKTPVMLNWTVGIRSLDHAIDLLDVKHAITSIRFLEKLDNEGFGKVEDKFIFLEEMRKEFSMIDKMKGLFVSMLPFSVIRSRLGIEGVSPNDPAVVLFTSGTETLPKAVPLSHFNIISNQSSCITSVTFNNDDFFFCVLPPFHSFGFSITGLLPLLAGIKALYSPDPTDYHRLVSEIEGYGVTMFCSAPSFIRTVFQAAKPGQLASIRLFVAGAEKAPQELFQWAKQCGSIMIEGYGITECSPVVTLNPIEEPPTGVGKPIKGVSLCVIDEQTSALIPNHKEGEICINGPSVFSGYLGSDKNPFITIDGKKWYRSGDRGYIDEKGFLILSGRLSRFLKVGGEMISIGGLEEDLQKIAFQKGWIEKDRKDIFLALSAKERQSEKPELVLFTTFPVDKEEVNVAIRDIGHGKIVKITDVKVIKEIPLTGTGKVAYRALEEMIQEQPKSGS